MREVLEVVALQFIAPVAEDRAHPVVDVQPGAIQSALCHADAGLVEGGAEQHLAPAQCAVAFLQFDGHGIERSGEAAELAAVRRRPARAARSPLRHRSAPRAADRADGGSGGCRARAVVASANTAPAMIRIRPLQVCLRHRGEGDIPVQSDPDAQSLRFGADRGIRRDALPAVEPLQLDDLDFVAFQAEAVFRDHGVADKPRAIGVSGQDRAIAVLDRRNGIRRQGKTLQLFSQPVDAERNLDHTRDDPLPVPEWLGHVDGRLIREPADRVIADDEASGLQGEAEEGSVGHVDAGVERAGRANECPSSPMTAAKL